MDLEPCLGKTEICKCQKTKLVEIYLTQQFQSHLATSSNTFLNSHNFRYIGNWKYDLREGQGEYRWSNGNRYHGEYHIGKPHGYGEYSSIKGDRYIGDFANGNFHGQGQFTFGTTNRTGDKYEGDFYKGEFHGNGTYVYANGDRFAGSFRFGKKNGRGVLYTHDGETIPGRWRNDKLVAELYIYPASGSIGLGQENPELRTNKNGIELEEQIDPEQQEKVTNISPPVVEST